MPHIVSIKGAEWTIEGDKAWRINHGDVEYIDADSLRALVLLEQALRTIRTLRTSHWSAELTVTWRIHPESWNNLRRLPPDSHTLVEPIPQKLFGINVETTTLIAPGDLELAITPPHPPNL
jgi:hypothetical protein